MADLPFPGLLPVDRRGFLVRAWMTLHALGFFLAGFISVLLFELLVSSLGLSVLIVGCVFLLVLVPVLARVTGVHRSVRSALTGRPVPGHYLDTSGADPVRRLLIWARDQTRWRDLAFVAFDATAGLTLSGLILSLASASFSLLVQPFLFDSPGWFLLWLAIPMTAALWWILTPILYRTHLLVSSRILGTSRTAELEATVARVSAARSESQDHSAAELRRIERDLHDGAQARMVSLGINLGLAEDLLRTDPEAAAALLDEARTTTLSALDDLRTVVRGILPPVLADRGLVGAVQALALDVALPVTVSASASLTGETAGRAPAPAESAMYFAVAECLANVVKHAHASGVVVSLTHRNSRLTVTVTDNGVGGALVSSGTGLRGLVRRLDTFDGRMDLDSPPGGPTIVTLELPCALSSPRTSPSSGTG